MDKENYMGSTLSHRGSRLVTRAELSQLNTPQGTNSWRPIPHFELINTIHSEIANRGLTVKTEKYAVQRGGNVIFGVMDLDWQDTGEEAAALGLRQANDKSLAIQIAVGLRIFNCDNLTMSGSLIALRRRHTSRLDLPKEISEGLDRYQEGFHRLQDDVGVWKNTELSDSRAREMIYDIFQKKIVPIRLFHPIHNTYFSNGYTKTAWGLMNSCTEHVKKLKPERKFQSTVKLGRYFEMNY